MPTAQTVTNLRLSGIRLTVARSVFAILSLAAMIFFSLGIPLYYNNFIKDINAETLATLRSLGLSGTFYAVYQTTLTTLLAVGSCAAGVIIFRFKSDEWVAMIVAFTLIGMGTNAFEPLGLAEKALGVRTPVIFVMGMILASHPAACYLLPDGKFPQKWMKYAAWFWFLWLMVSVFVPSFPVNLFNWADGGFETYLYSLLTALLTGIYALVYRYIRSDNAIKKQQLKWVVFSIVMAVVIGVGSNIFITIFEKTNPSAGARMIVVMGTQIISVAAQLSVPTAMVFSILRYRLYDIELVINRSLIYGLLTIFLAAVFGGILIGLQTLFRSITGQDNPPTVGVVIATVVVSGIFQPTRHALRRFVNQKIYGMDVDLDEMERQNKKLNRSAHLPSRDMTSVGSYKNLELIGRGGMGEVYKAEHPHLHRIVAIKVLSAYLKDDPTFNMRFAREAKAMAQLRHPNIINIFDYGDLDGLPYIVMEYLTGPTLSQILKDKPRLSLDECLLLLKDLASALDYAHEQNLIHRDLKPSNVIVEPVTSTKGNPHRAVLMDFGIARFKSENTVITVSGDMLGTADYVSPEQIQGMTDLDHRADVYSLGVVTYQMLTGKKPFDRHNTWAMIRAHLEEPVPDPRESVSLSEHTARAVMKAMAKKPEERFSSAGEFVEALAN